MSRIASLRLFIALRGAVAVVASLLLASCALPPQPSTVAAPTAHTALAVIDVDQAAMPHALPARLVLHVEADGGGASHDVTLDAETRIPGVDASYPARIALPPGRYRLTHLTGVAPPGDDGPRLDLATRVAFAVGTQSPLYLGHLALAAGQALTVSDRTTEDWPVFVRRWPELRGQAPAFGLVSIEASPAPMPVPAAVAAAPRAAEPASAPTSSGSYIEPVSLTPGDGAKLPPKARGAFARFVALSLPRAMALSADGVPSLASGADAIDTALARCRKRDRRSACRLHAVDNTLLDIPAAPLPDTLAIASRPAAARP